MKENKGLGLAVCTVILFSAVGAMADRSASDSRIMPIGPMKFEGRVTIANQGRQFVSASVQVWKGGVGVSGGAMTLLGTRLESEVNRYYGAKEGTALRSGDMVTVVFQPPYAGLPAWTATLAATTRILFTSPRLDSHVAVGRPGNLEVRWSGGTPPYKLWVHYLSGGRHTQLLALESLAAGSANIPLARFTPGTVYEIQVADAERRFALDRDVDPSGLLAMNQWAMTSFRAD